jgi:hypothetical protein
MMQRKDEAILKQGLLTLHRGGVSVPGMKKKRIEVTLCHPSTLADVQQLYERLFLDVSAGSGLDRRTIMYLGQLSFAAAKGSLFVCMFILSKCDSCYQMHRFSFSARPMALGAQSLFHWQTCHPPTRMIL